MCARNAEDRVRRDGYTLTAVLGLGSLLGLLKGFALEPVRRTLPSTVAAAWQGRRGLWIKGTQRGLSRVCEESGVIGELQDFKLRKKSGSAWRRPLCRPLRPRRPAAGGAISARARQGKEPLEQAADVLYIYFCIRLSPLEGVQSALSRSVASSNS
jgi:hypothetical protein